MNAVKRIRHRLRSIRGQVWLLAATYAGAALLAVAALCLRGWLFDSRVRQRSPEIPGKVLALAQAVAVGTKPAESTESLKPLDVEAVYGALIDGTVVDKESHLAKALFRFHSEKVVSRLAITVATGNQDQQRRGLMLARAASPNDALRVLPLVRYLHERTRRRKQSRLRDLSESVLRRLEHQAQETQRNP